MGNAEVEERGRIASIIVVSNEEGREDFARF